jgi:hypothetical protein
MNVGDLIVINGNQFTIWLIEDFIYHLIDDKGYGVCGDINWLNSVKE